MHHSATSPSIAVYIKAYVAPMRAVQRVAKVGTCALKMATCGNRNICLLVTLSILVVLGIVLVNREQIEQGDAALREKAEPP